MASSTEASHVTEAVEQQQEELNPSRAALEEERERLQRRLAEVQQALKQDGQNGAVPAPEKERSQGSSGSQAAVSPADQKQASKEKWWGEMHQLYMALPKAQRGANDKALIKAAKKGDLTEVKNLLEQVGANPDALGPNPYFSWVPASLMHLHGTALFWAVEGRQLAVVKYLVEAGAAVNARTSCGGTPTSSAHINRYREIASYLQSQGGRSPA